MKLAEELPSEVVQLFERAAKAIDGCRQLHLTSVLGIDWAENAQDLAAQIEEPFSIFFCGEFNSGKSSLINSLAGSHVADVGVLPTTSAVVKITLDQSLGLNLVDSPGLNSILNEHQKAAERFLRRSDFVAFVTSAERPLTDSESRFIGAIKNRWGRKLIVLINKIDLLTSDERGRVRDFVAAGLRETLGLEPPIFLVSTRTGDGIADIAEFFKGAFADAERSRIKLQAVNSSLKVFVETAIRKLESETETIGQQLGTLEKVANRWRSRITEASAAFDTCEVRTARVFRDLAQKLDYLIDTQFGFWKLLKGRITGGRQDIDGMISGILREIELDKKLQDIIDDAAEKLSIFETLLAAEAADILSSAPSGSASDPGLAAVRADIVDSAAIAGELRSSIEKGLNKFIALGSAAAASGLGAKLAVLSSVEITAAVLGVFFAAFSLRALPSQKRSAKSEMMTDLDGLAAEFSSTLKKAALARLTAITGSFEDALAPRLQHLSSGLAARKLEAEKFSTLNVELESLDHDLKTLSGAVRNA